MQELYDQLIANKVPVGISLAAVWMFWDKIVAFISKLRRFKLPVMKSTVVVIDDIEGQDQSALKHLRVRAVEIGDIQLASLIKDIDAKFYDIHAGVKNEK